MALPVSSVVSRRAAGTRLASLSGLVGDGVEGAEPQPTGLTPPPRHFHSRAAALGRSPLSVVF